MTDFSTIRSKLVLEHLFEKLSCKGDYLKLFQRLGELRSKAIESPDVKTIRGMPHYLQGLDKSFQLTLEP